MNLKELKNKVADGVDIDSQNFLVSFNPNHQNNVDTNDLYNPRPFYDELEGHKVISVFERKSSDSRYDGNPLIYALKNYGKTEEELKKSKSSASKWRFANPQYDILALMRRFVAVTKEFDIPFDTIVYVPSTSPLNAYVARCTKRIKEEILSGSFLQNTMHPMFRIICWTRMRFCLIFQKMRGMG